MDVDRRGAAVTLDSARLEAALERGVSGAGRALGERLEGLETRVARLAESQSQGLDALTRIAAVAGARDEATGPALEGALSAGFARVSQTMETAFSAYSSLLHVVVATMEQAAAAPSAIDAPEAPPPATSAEDLLAEEFRRRAGRKS
jgi:hypothetical protein